MAVTLAEQDATNDGPVTDEMIADWESVLERDEWPSGLVNVGEIVEGKLPGGYALAGGGSITDEDIERECAEYESGTWDGHLANLRAGESARDREIMEMVEDFRAGRLETATLDELEESLGLDG